MRWLSQCSVLPIAAALAIFPHSRYTDSSSLAESALISSNGTQLYLEMRGPAKRSPIMLYLHGGPGQAIGLVSFRSYVGPPLESRLLVCYLHQRGTLFSPAVPDASLTVANHIADVHNVINYLRTRFPGRKIYLLGHSWGGTLAVASMLDKAGAVAGVVDVAGPLNLAADLSASYEVTMKWAEETHNSEAVQELKTLGPPPYHDIMQQIAFSKWSSSARGGIDQHFSMEKLLGRAPFTSMQESWQDAQIRIVRAMYSELSQINLEPRVAYVKTPLLLINGKLDSITPSSALQESFRLYGGTKHWVEMDASHHLPFVDEPDAFVKAVIDFVH
ncbi:MAG TPA: alpha/beta hydrolase [Blastocatellia bacterium]|nr:alpha/beta hydrolase [Blastocatellia bacterium]